MTARTYTGLGASLNAHGRYSEAARDLRRALDVYDRLASAEGDVAKNRLYRSDTARVLYQLGTADRGRGHFTDAESSFRRACETYEQLNAEAPEVLTYRGNLARTYHDLGSLYRLLGRPADAEAWHRRAVGLYEQVVIQNPTVAEYHMGLGWARYKLGCHEFAVGDRGRTEQDWTTAAAEFSAAADLGFGVAGAYKAFGDAQAMLGHWEQAANAYGRVAEAYHFAAVPTLQWALLQLAAGDEQGYGAACARLVNEFGASASGSLALSIVMTCVAGNPPANTSSEALRLAQRVLGTNLGNPVGQVFLAAAQYRAGETREAIAAIEAALPKLALAELAAPTKRDFVRLARLAGETILVLSYEQLRDQDALARQLGVLRATIDAISARPPQYSDGTNEWTVPLALHIARRELERLESQTDSPEVK